MNIGTISITKTVDTDIDPASAVTFSGSWRFSILSADGSTVVQTKDVSAQAASFSDLPDGNYIGGAQALGDDGSLLGTPLTGPFTAPTPVVVAKTFPQPSALAFSFSAQ